MLDISENCSVVDPKIRRHQISPSRDVHFHTLMSIKHESLIRHKRGSTLYNIFLLFIYWDKLNLCSRGESV